MSEKEIAGRGHRPLLTKHNLRQIVQHHEVHAVVQLVPLARFVNVRAANPAVVLLPAGLYGQVAARAIWRTAVENGDDVSVPEQVRFAAMRQRVKQHGKMVVDGQCSPLELTFGPDLFGAETMNG